jgi:hypothetical protein
MKSLLVKLGVILLVILTLWGCYAKFEVLKEYAQRRIDPSSINDQEQFQKDLDECIRFGNEERNRAIKQASIPTPWSLLADPQAVSIQ